MAYNPRTGWDVGGNVNAYVGSRYANAEPIAAPIPSGQRQTSPQDKARLENIKAARANNDFLNPVTGQKGNQFEIQRFLYNQAHQKLGTGNTMDANGHIFSSVSTPRTTLTPQEKANGAFVGAGTGAKGTFSYQAPDGSVVHGGEAAAPGLQTDVYGNPNNLAGPAPRVSTLPVVPNFTPAAPLDAVPSAPRYVPELGSPVQAAPAVMVPDAPQINTTPQHSEAARYLAGLVTANSAFGGAARFGMRYLTGFRF